MATFLDDVAHAAATAVASERDGDSSSSHDRAAAARAHSLDDDDDEARSDRLQQAQTRGDRERLDRHRQEYVAQRLQDQASEPTEEDDESHRRPPRDIERRAARKPKQALGFGAVVLDHTAADFWDDTALIKLYEDSVRTYRTAAEGGEGGDAAMEEEETVVWSVGDDCAAIWSEDGELYEAEIESINRTDGLCVVKFKGYGNTEEVKLVDLAPPGTGINGEEDDEAVGEGEAMAVQNEGWKVDDLCQFHDNVEAKDCVGRIESISADGTTCDVVIMHDTDVSRSSVPIASLRPGAVRRNTATSSSQDEELAKLTYSWYLTGYQTGYYQCLRENKKV